VATISRNLAELRHEGLESVSTSSTISLFRNSSLPRRIVEQEPVIQVTLSLLVCFDSVFRYRGAILHLSQ